MSLLPKRSCALVAKMCNSNQPMHFRVLPVCGDGAVARCGTTLLEVLIAIGVLAIGLSALVAAIPAANAIAKRAVITDTATLVAENALAHAVTSGLCRVDSLNESHRRLERAGGQFLEAHTSYYRNPNNPKQNRIWHTLFISDRQSAAVLEPAIRPVDTIALRNNRGLGGQSTDLAPNGGYITPKANRLFAQIGDNLPIDSRAWQLDTTARDDLQYFEPAGANDSSLRDHVIDGTRFSIGRYSVLYALSGLPAIDLGFGLQGFAGNYHGHAFNAGCTITLSSIVFYDRPQEPDLQLYEGYIEDYSIEASSRQEAAVLQFMIKFRKDKFKTLPEGQTIKDVFAPGTVLYFPRAEGLHRFAQIVAMFPTIYRDPYESTGDTYQVTVTGGARHLTSQSWSGPVFLFAGSVALAQRLVTLEGDGSLYPVPPIIP
jgi:type II secretory pathway pseudopilin PulG